MKENKREYYLDWLRIIVVLLLVPHHIAITFSHIGDAYVFLPVKDNSLYFFIQSTFLNLWFMRMLFFVSGISTYYALKKRTNKEYFLERCKRLLLPAVFAIIAVCPVMAYFRALNLNGFQGSLFKFYPVFFTKFETYLGWAHFWFLIYLFMFSMVFLLLRVLIKNSAGPEEKIGTFLARKKNIILPIVLFIVFEMILRPFFPGIQNIVDDWANIMVYLSFFMLGYLFASRKECLDKIEENIPVFLGIGIIATTWVLFLKYAQNYTDYFARLYNTKEYQYKVITAFFQGAAEYSLVMLFTGIAKKVLNFKNRVYDYLSNTSFSLYMFHFILVNLVMYYLIRLNMNHYLMYILGIILVYVLFIVLFELVIKRIPFLRYICGIKTAK
ncbi:acyltransferase family protein [Breznakiella homolactica]|uniref:Acyltransferase family protein n=2 Tax=Breznakiella homolactica TaxID=2798577 RepID=A0A7T8BBF9_9SPIR|nr:acyltransferase family protein [Breznakiella homolactica]QQO09995.1 acyltransferase family protein [Breznakiella homolactica]